MILYEYICFICKLLILHMKVSGIKLLKNKQSNRWKIQIIPNSGIFHVGIIFAEFATSLKLPKINPTIHFH